MPRNPVAARRYVRALGLVAEEKSEAQKVLVELKGFQALLAQSKDLRSFFFSPVIPKSDKKDAIMDLKERLPLSHRFLSVLVEGNRLSVLDEIVDGFEASLESASGELSVTLEVARTLPDASIEEIRALLQEKWKRTVRLKTQVNPSILGGFVARAPGKILDASVAHQFEVLKQSLVTQ